MEVVQPESISFGSHERAACGGTFGGSVSSSERGLLVLPLELRLMIYSLVVADHPLVQPQLDAAYPNAAMSAYSVAPVKRSVSPDGHSDAKTSDDDDDNDDDYGSNDGSSDESNIDRTDRSSSTTDLSSTTTNTEANTLLFSSRPRGFVPQALLRSCRQIYSEARAAALAESEFVFTTTPFSGAATSALAFLRTGLSAPWQRASVRFLRLELAASDLVVGGSRIRAQAWLDLCELLTTCACAVEGGGGGGGGLRGLRLRIALAAASDACELLGLGEHPVDKSATTWVRKGLKRLHTLRSVEVEFAMKGQMAAGQEGPPRLDSGRRLAWAGTLSCLLNEGRPDDERTTVLCVESR